MALQWLERQDIDEIKWEQCINKSLFPSLFVRIWYLDILTDSKWQAVVDGDYTAVFPVFKKKKFGLPYITMPFLCQRTGIFTAPDYHPNSELFFKFLSQNMLKWELKLENPPISIGKSSKKINHFLHLSKPYNDIRKNYNRNTERNITKSYKDGVEIASECDVDLIFNFIKDHDITGLSDKFNQQVKLLISESINKGVGFCFKAMLKSEVVSIGFFIEDSKRLYFLLCASNDTGKSARSIYQLIDHVIKIKSEKNMIFDFTGSSSANIARRNEGFGAEQEVYYHLKWNFLGL